MRYRHLFEKPMPLYESKAYNAMFDALLRDHPKMTREVKAMVNRARLALKREDRIVWFLRWYRISLEVDLLPRKRQELVPSAAEYVRRSGMPPAEMQDAQHLRPESVLAKLEHYVGLPAPAIQQRVWQWEDWRKLLKELDEAERAWVNGGKDGSRIVAPKTGDKILIEFPNGLAWWLLDRNSCSDEARAMRHCGNSPSNHSPDGRKERIISLRETIHKGVHTFFKPYLTFVLMPDGHLGEMKGFANQSPIKAHAKGMPSAFHDEIAALLKLPMIKGIRGGQWLTGEDFQLTQLPEAVRQSVLWDRPEFAEVAITNYASLIKQLGDTIQKYRRGQESDEIDDDWFESENGPPETLDRMQVFVGKFRHLIGLLPVGIRGYENMHRFIKVDDEIGDEEPGEKLDEFIQAGEALTQIRLSDDYLMMMRLSNLLMNGPTDASMTDEFWESPSGPPEFMNNISTTWVPAAERLLAQNHHRSSPLMMTIQKIVDLFESEESPSEIYEIVEEEVLKFRRANGINPIA